MKHYLILLAGGVGSRIGGPIPKQFLSLNDKPVIIHTLENFQKNENIDGIVIVCLKDWISYMQDLIAEYNITKVIDIVEGGETGHDSTRNGIFSLKNKLTKDDFVIIHDAARPILPQKAINDMIETAHKTGNASLAIPCYETVIYTDDGKQGIEQLDRTKLMRVQTPQAYKYDLLLELYEKAEKENREAVLLPRITSHILRHTFGTRMMEKGVNVKAMQTILGHKDIQTTLDIYTDAQSEFTKNEIGKME